MREIYSHQELKHIKSKYISISPCIINTTLLQRKKKGKERMLCHVVWVNSTYKVEIASLRTHARAATGGPNQESPQPADDNGLILDQPSFSN